MRGRAAILGTMLRLGYLAMAVALPTTALAGGGTIRIVDEVYDPATNAEITRGLIDLNVSLGWDPTDPVEAATMWDMDELERQFRTASVVLCDATDGRFRIGRVNFAIDPMAKIGADVWFYGPDAAGDRRDSSTGDTYGIGRNGTHVNLGYHEESAGIVLAHELGHHLFGMKDQYKEDADEYDLDPCPTGRGFTDDTNRTERNNTLMDRGVQEDDNIAWTANDYMRRGYCFIRVTSPTTGLEEWWPNGVDIYTPTAAGGWNLVPQGDYCLSTEECVDPAWRGTYDPAGRALMVGGNFVWGEGAGDNVVCLPIMHTELTSLEGHDPDNGLGPLFDHRATDGQWGYAPYMNSGLTYPQQLAKYFDQFVSHSCLYDTDANRMYWRDGAGIGCLDECPTPKQTDRVNIALDIPGGGAPDANQKVVGQIYTYDELRNLDNQDSGRIFIFDPLGIYWSVASEEDCNERLDSRHRLLATLQFVPNGANPVRYLLSLSMPNPDFVGALADPSCDDPANAFSEANEFGNTGLACQYQVIAQQEILVNGAGNLTFVGDEDGNPNDNTGTITVNAPQLQLNECYRRDSEATASSGDDNFFERDPNPFQFAVTTTVNNIGPAADLTIEESAMAGERHVGNCAWKNKRAGDGSQRCAMAWEPFSATDIHDGDWTSSRQTIDNAEWEWNTLNRFYGEVDGVPFVTDVRDAINQVQDWNAAECFSYQNRDGIAGNADDALPLGAYNVRYSLQNANQVLGYLLFDNSASMGVQDSASGYSRLYLSATAGSEMLDNLYDWMVDTNYPVTGTAEMGLIRFSEAADCFGTKTDNTCDPYDMSDDTDVSSAHSDIANNLVWIPATGLTALKDSLIYTEAVILTQEGPRGGGGPARGRYIYMLTDSGYDSASKSAWADRSFQEIGEELMSNNITVFVMAIGGMDSNFKDLSEMADLTGGTILYADEEDAIANSALLMLAESVGGGVVGANPRMLVLNDSKAIQEVEVDGSVIITDNPAELTFPIEEGVKQMTLLLTNHGYGEDHPPSPPGTNDIPVPSNWDLDVVLLNPDGEEEENAVITHVANSLVRIEVPEPPAGEWHLQLTNSKSGYALRTFLTIAVNNPKIRFRVDANPGRIFDGGTVSITPHVSFDGIDLDRDFQ